MKMFRLLTSALVTLLMGLALGVSVPAHATDPEAPTAPAPERIIEWKEKQKDWRTFVIKGKVQDLKKGKVLVQKKSCRACKWKTVSKVKTNNKTRFKTRIYAPNKGKWFWRFQVNAGGGYDRTRSIKIAMYLK